MAGQAPVAVAVAVPVAEAEVEVEVEVEIHPRRHLPRLHRLLIRRRLRRHLRRRRRTPLPPPRHLRTPNPRRRNRGHCLYLDLIDQQGDPAVRRSLSCRLRGQEWQVSVPESRTLPAMSMNCQE